MGLSSQNLLDGQASFFSSCGPQVDGIVWKLVSQMVLPSCLPLTCPGLGRGPGVVMPMRPQVQGRERAQPSTRIPLQKAGRAFKMGIGQGSPSGAGEGLKAALWIETLPLKVTASVWVLAALHLSSVPANVHRDFPVKCG